MHAPVLEDLALGPPFSLIPLKVLQLERSQFSSLLTHCHYCHLLGALLNMGSSARWYNLFSLLEISLRVTASDTIHYRNCSAEAQMVLNIICTD